MQHHRCPDISIKYHMYWDRSPEPNRIGMIYYSYDPKENRKEYQELEEMAREHILEYVQKCETEEYDEFVFQWPWIQMKFLVNSLQVLRLVQCIWVNMQMKLQQY